MKKGLKILITLIILIAVIMGGALIALTQGLEEGKSVTINGLNLSNIEDGTYNGKYDFKRWSNELGIKVKDHKIMEIKVVKDVRFANPAVTIQLFNEVIEAQDTTVDLVSGSTVTAKANLKAIENAFKK
ncbi:MAG: hypothetical protein WBI17_00365 [Clostridiaceae bacterium]